MKFLIIQTHTMKYIDTVLSDGSAPLDHVFSCVNFLKEKESISEILYLATEESKIPEKVLQYTQKTYRIKNTIQALIDKIYAVCKKEDVCITWADSMFSYIPIYEKMIDTHKNYLSQYTRSEGYPNGVVPEIFNFVACQMLYYTSKEQSNNNLLTQAITRESLFKVVELRINDYDIEAFLSPSDMRMYRISLTADTRNNFHIARKLWEEGLRNPNDIPELYMKKPKLFRGLPRYVYMQVSNISHGTIYDIDFSLSVLDYCNSDSIPFNTSNVLYMSDKVFNSLLEKYSSYNNEAIICLGCMGETSLHPNIFSIIYRAAKAFSHVYIETTGLCWDMENEWWKSIPSNISWIVFLDALTKETYHAIRKSYSSDVAYTAFEKSSQFLHFLIQHNIPCHAQATRISENEGELDAFCKYWNSKKAAPIIQKYNNMCGGLAQKKVIDLSPIKRFPCRHLERDMVICLDGDVLLCQQDYRKEHVLGNICTDEIEHLWSLNEVEFVKHVHKEYMKICEKCDEYYICNA